MPAFWGSGVDDDALRERVAHVELNLSGAVSVVSGDPAARGFWIKSAGFPPLKVRLYPFHQANQPKYPNNPNFSLEMKVYAIATKAIGFYEDPATAIAW